MTAAHDRGAGIRSTPLPRFQGWTCGPGDEVVQAESDDDEDGGELVATFDGREVVYGFGEFGVLVVAHATTARKAQGSEYLPSVLPAMTQHYAMLGCDLPYTGVTRGKRLVVLAGRRRAIAMASRNGGQRRRWSNLGEWLSAA